MNLEVFSERGQRATSADSLILPTRRPFLGLLVVGATMLSGTSAYATSGLQLLGTPLSATDAGQSVSEVVASSEDILELRKLTGLTWEQLASLFEVSRRSVHFWASGKEMTAKHREHLDRSLSSLRAVDRGTSGANRLALFAVDASGVAPFDLLVKKSYPEFVLAMGRQTASAVKIRPAVVVDETRLPPPPATLVDIASETAHVETSPIKRARITRI